MAWKIPQLLFRPARQLQKRVINYAECRFQRLRRQVWPNESGQSA